MSSLLQRLRPAGAGLAQRDLASGERQRWAEEALGELVEPFGRELSLDALDAGLDELLATTPRHDARIDSAAAVLVHRALKLTRREAADIGVWRWLAVVHRPDVVRHRWENSSWASTRRRFLAPGTRPDSNTFARWWWIAELSRAGDDYSLTTRVLRRQPLATAIFVRSLASYGPAVRACVEVLEEVDAGLIERVMLELSRTLATVPLEAMSEAALVVELRRILARLGGSGSAAP
jgi:hypothetical protein